MKLVWAEVLVAILAVCISLGGSWVLAKEQLATNTATMASISNSLLENKSSLSQVEHRAVESEKEIALLKERSVQLERSTKAYVESLNGLREVLGELNVTLGRMDERMINMEKGIESMRQGP